MKTVRKTVIKIKIETTKPITDNLLIDIENALKKHEDNCIVSIEWQEKGQDSYCELPEDPLGKEKLEFKDITTCRG